MKSNRIAVTFDSISIIEIESNSFKKSKLFDFHHRKNINENEEKTQQFTNENSKELSQ